MRDALESLAFGEVAAKVALRPLRRTEVNGGRLVKVLFDYAKAGREGYELNKDDGCLERKLDPKLPAVPVCEYRKEDVFYSCT